MYPKVTQRDLNRMEPSISSFYLKTNLVGITFLPLSLTSCNGKNFQAPRERKLLNSAVQLSGVPGSLWIQVW